MKSPYWTVVEVAEYLRLNKFTVYKMAQRGKIPCVKITDKWRFTKESIDEWVMVKMSKSKGAKHLILSRTTNE